MGLRFQKGDIVAIALVLVLAVAVVLLFLSQNHGQAAQVEIYRNGQLVATLPLEQDGSYTLTGEYTNVITVSDGRVSVTCSDCPGQDCVHSGSVSTVGRSLACLPNGMEVRIVGKTGDVDFVVG